MTVGGATEDSLAERRKLGTEGVVTVVAIVASDGTLAEEPDFLTHGFVHEPNTFADLVPKLQQALATKQANKQGNKQGRPPTRAGIEDVIRREVANWALRRFRRRPVVIPVVIDA